MENRLDVLVLCSDMNSPPWDFSEIIHIVVYIYYMFRRLNFIPHEVARSSRLRTLHRYTHG